MIFICERFSKEMVVFFEEMEPCSQKLLLFCYVRAFPWDKSVEEMFFLRTNMLNYPLGK
jgi:hypothetical protein